MNTTGSVQDFLDALSEEASARWAWRLRALLIWGAMIFTIIIMGSIMACITQKQRHRASKEQVSAEIERFVEGLTNEEVAKEDKIALDRLEVLRSRGRCAVDLVFGCFLLILVPRGLWALQNA